MNDGSAGPGDRPAVTTVLLNYNAPPETLRRCLDSLERQTYPNHHVLLVDNASAGEMVAGIEKEHRGVEVLKLDRNYGFSGGINRGVAAATGKYVFLLNFDTVVEPECVAAMVGVAEEDENIAGVAPKIMLASHPHVFDSIGTALGDDAGAFNQGIGQPDIGQYDVSERVFGSCFGATLLRREAFAEAAVGPLDESYFMYFEDFDWCYRANLLGYSFRTAPAAVVHHEHSASVRDRDYEYKYRLIERHLLRTVVKNYQRRQMVKIPVRRLRTHLVNGLDFRSGRAAVSWKIVGGFLADFPRLLPRRWQVQRRRRAGDLDILKFSYGEQPHFDPTTYSPIYNLDTLIAAYRRLYVVSGDERALEIWRALEGLNGSKLRFEQQLLRQRLEEVLRGQPEHVIEFAARIGAQP